MFLRSASMRRLTVTALSASLMTLAAGAWAQAPADTTGARSSITTRVETTIAPPQQAPITTEIQSRQAYPGGQPQVSPVQPPPPAPPAAGAPTPGAAPAAGSIPAPQPRHLQNWNTEDTTREAQYHTARRDVGGAYQQAIKECQARGAANQAACEADAKARHDREMLEVKQRFEGKPAK